MDKKSRVSRRERPAKPALSREGIVDAALEIVTSDGVEKLTMRRLATDLDTGPASLYVYVRNMTELHALVIDQLLGALDVSRRDDDWRPWIHRLLGDYMTLLAQHPGLARSALVAWPDGPHYLHLIEALLGAMIDGGIAPGRAAWGVDLLLQFATSSAGEWSTRAEVDEQGMTDLVSTLDHADPGRHPLLTSLSEELVSGGHGDRLAWMLDSLINGISQTIRPGEAGGNFLAPQ